MVVMYTIVPFSALSLGLRLWSRHIQRQSLAFNDWMVIVSMVLLVGIVVNTTASTATWLIRFRVETTNME